MTDQDNYDQGRYGSYEQNDDDDDDDHYGSFGGNVNVNVNVDYDEDDALFAAYTGTANGNGQGPGPGILLAILENAVRQHHDETTMLAMASPEEVQRKREHLEQTWKEIRIHWLWAHETREERSVAVYIRGAEDLAPLHLICKLTNNPPTDIISEIIQAAPEVAGWVDTHMWLPLHHACINGASTEVLQLLTSVYPESKASLDAHKRTPLHLYATRGNSDNYNPVTMATNFTLLSSVTSSDSESIATLPVSAAEVRDTAGMIPMHYACAYGTSTSVLKVLEDAYPQSLNAKDDNGRTPLHFVMVNAQRTASPGVLGFLLGYNGNDGDDDTAANTTNNASSNNNGIRNAGVNARDHEGNLPLHLLNIGLTGVNLKQDPEKFNNVAECLKLYLAAEPYASTGFLAALQGLPDLLQDVAVVSPHVRNVLNNKIIQRFPTSILVSENYQSIDRSIK